MCFSCKVQSNSSFIGSLAQSKWIDQFIMSIFCRSIHLIVYAQLIIFTKFFELGKMSSIYKLNTFKCCYSFYKIISTEFTIFSNCTGKQLIKRKEKLFMWFKSFNSLQYILSSFHF